MTFYWIFQFVFNLLHLNLFVGPTGGAPDAFRRGPDCTSAASRQYFDVNDGELERDLGGSACSDRKGEMQSLE